MYKIYIPAILFLLTCNSALSQDAAKVKKIKILPVPVFGYSPETRTYVGAVMLFTLDLYGDAGHANVQRKI